MAHRTVHLTSMMSPTTLAVVSTLIAALCCGCTNINKPVYQPSFTEATPLLQQAPLIPASCLVEGVALPQSCNEGPWAPECTGEDSGIDGTPNAACFWQDPDTGLLWWDNGDGIDN